MMMVAVCVGSGGSIGIDESSSTDSTIDSGNMVISPPRRTISIIKPTEFDSRLTKGLSEIFGEIIIYLLADFEL